MITVSILERYIIPHLDNAGPNLINFLLQVYRTPSVVSDASTHMAALTCSRAPCMVKRPTLYL